MADQDDIQQAGISQSSALPDDAPVDQEPYDPTNSNRRANNAGDSSPQSAITAPEQSGSTSSSKDYGRPFTSLSDPFEQIVPFLSYTKDDDGGPIETDSGSAGPETAQQSHNPISSMRRGVKKFFHRFSGDEDTPKTASAPNRRSLNLATTTALAAAAASGLDNWQAILNAHADCNANGNPIDDHGKEINLRDMNPEFGRKLAQTCMDLDASGFQGQYSILSGVRTHSEQLGLYNYYKGMGSNHPVAAPGTSPHEWGVATDLQYKGHGSKESFYRALHEKGRANGMEFVVGDENHVQLANSHQVIAQLQTSRNNTQLAAARRNPVEAPASG